MSGRKIEDVLQDDALIYYLKDTEKQALELTENSDLNWPTLICIGLAARFKYMEERLDELILEQDIEG